MNEEEIKRKADELRAKQLNKEQKTVEKQKKEAVTFLTDKQVFHYIHPTRVNKVIGIAILLLGLITCLTLYLSNVASNYIVPILIVSISIFIFSFAKDFLNEKTNAKIYLKWLTEMPFAFEDWKQLNQKVYLKNYYTWDDEVTFSINLKEGTTENTQQLIENVLLLFTQKANASFYTAEFTQVGLAGDIRKKWMVVSSQQIKGSANNHVLGRIYELCKKELTEIQQKYNCIRQIRLTFSNNTYDIEPLTSD